MSQWKYARRIEQMSDEDLRERISSAMEFVIESAIRPIPYLGEETETVEYRYPELTAKCPMTGARDFYELVIRFQPDKVLPELKSLKLYLVGYDDLPISHEHLAAKIYKEFKEVVSPLRVGMVLHTAVRGGIKTTVTLGDDL